MEDDVSAFLASIMDILGVCQWSVATVACGILRYERFTIVSLATIVIINTRLYRPRFAYLI